MNPRTTDLEAPVQLSRELVVERAVELADREGLAAVTFRRLADEFGVTPMALYWHVDSKEELLAAMADRLYLGITPVPHPGAPWSDELRALAVALTAALRAHANLAPLAGPRILESEDGRRLTERALEVLRGAGFSVEQSAEIARHTLRTAVALVIEESDIARSAADEGRDDLWRAKRAGLESLEPALYPRLIEAADALTACDDPERFYRYGLDLLVAGVVAMQPTEAAD